jgi:hypothetical protein
MPGAHSLLRCLFLSAACALAASQAAAEGARGEAPLPGAESFVYARKVGAKLDKVEMRTRFVQDGGGGYYELSTKAPEAEALYKLSADKLLEFYSEVTTRSDDATIRRVSALLENRATPAEGEILAVGSGESLAQSLRCFPWGTRTKARIGFIGAGKARADYRFELSVAGKESLELAGRQVECWKVQLSMSGLLGSFVGTTRLWYSVVYPHCLVRSESPSGLPGSPATVLSLESSSPPIP